jgi:hypothetical protein
MVSKQSFKDSLLKNSICMYNILWQMEGQDENNFIINDQSIIFHVDANFMNDTLQLNLV